MAVALGLASSEGAQTDRIDGFVEGQMKAQRIPGLSLAVIKDGKIVKAAGWTLEEIAAGVAAFYLGAR